MDVRSVYQEERNKTKTVFFSLKNRLYVLTCATLNPLWNRSECVVIFFRLCAAASMALTEDFVIFHRIWREAKNQAHLLEQLKVFLLSVSIFFPTLIKTDSVASCFIFERKQSQFYIQVTDIYIPILLQLDLNIFFNHLFYAVVNEVHHVLSWSYKVYCAKRQQDVLCDSSNKKIS